MHPALMILMVVLVYVVLYGGFSLVRRTELSTRFAIEAVLISVVVAALVFVSSYSFNPVLFAEVDKSRRTP